MSLVADQWSDPCDESGYSAHDILSLGFIASPKHAALVEQSKPLADLDPADYDAIFLVGGQRRCHLSTPLRDLPFYEPPSSPTRGPGSADSEEDFADAFVGQRIQPFRIEGEAKKLQDTNFVVSGRFKPFAVRDGLLVTGRQQYSGGPAAKLSLRRGQSSSEYWRVAPQSVRALRPNSSARPDSPLARMELPAPRSYVGEVALGMGPPFPSGPRLGGSQRRTLTDRWSREGSLP